MSANPSKVLQVVACVIEHQGKYLITQRLKRSHLGHLWEFPGGKIEAGESQKQCAIRECQEEINILVKPQELISETLHHYPTLSVQLYFWLCEWLSGNLQAIECADFAWVKPTELQHYEFPAADRALVEQLAKVGTKKSAFSISE